MNENLIDFLLGEKSRGFFKISRFLSKDFILLAQARELLADILLRSSSKSACRARIATDSKSISR